MATKKSIQITVTGTIELPASADPSALEGMTVDIAITGAQLRGVQMQAGRVEDPILTGRRRNRQPVDSVLKIGVNAEDVTITEAAGPGRS